MEKKWFLVWGAALFVSGVVGYFIGASGIGADLASNTTTGENEVSILIKDDINSLIAEIALSRQGFQRTNTAYQLISKYPEQKLADLLPSMLEVKDEPLRLLLMTVFFQRYTGISPDVSIGHFEKSLKRHDSLYLPVLGVVYATWSGREPQKAVTHAMQIQDLSVRDFVLRALLEQRSLPTDLSGSILASLSSEGKAAIQLQKTIPLDPFVAIHTALLQPAGAKRAALLRSAYTQWMLEAPVVALAQIDSIPAGDRQEVVSAAIVNLAEQQPERVLNYINGISGNATQYLSLALGVLASKNPRYALEWIYQNKELDSQVELIGVVVPTLIRSNLSLASEAVSSMKGKAPISLIKLVAVEYAKTDPKRAYEWVGTLLGYRSESSALLIINEVSNGIVSVNSAGAENYLLVTPDKRVKDSLIREVSNHKVQEGLQPAWAWLNKYGTEPAYKENARGFLYRWSYMKPEDVAGLLSIVQDDELKNAAIKHLAHVWQKQDVVAYLAWVASLPDGATKALALSSE